MSYVLEHCWFEPATMPQQLSQHFNPADRPRGWPYLTIYAAWCRQNVAQHDGVPNEVTHLDELKCGGECDACWDPELLNSMVSTGLCHIDGGRAGFCCAWHPQILVWFDWQNRVSEDSDKYDHKQWYTDLLTESGTARRFWKARMTGHCLSASRPKKFFLAAVSGSAVYYEHLHWKDALSLSYNERNSELELLRWRRFKKPFLNGRTRAISV